MLDLALLYEHPQWFKSLFEVLDRRGVAYVALHADGHHFDPAGSLIPARVVFNRIAMSSFLRSPEHPIFYTQALMTHWAARGARIINGADVMAIDASKARQLSLISALGLSVPATRVVHRVADIPGVAEALRFPIVVKANIGGSGAGIVRYDTREMLLDAVRDGATPNSIDRVLLVQEYVPARGDKVTRVETLGGRFLYAIDIDGGGSFDLCPADVCVTAAGKPSIAITKAEPEAAIIAAAERIAQAAELHVGGIEVMIDDRDGTPRFYDINALSNFVADPMGVLGWDPHERLVDWLQERIAEVAA